MLKMFTRKYPSDSVSSDEYALVSLYKQLKRYTNALLNQFLATQTPPGVNYPRVASLVCNDYKIEPRKSSPVRKVQGPRNIVNWPDLETLRKIHKCILVYKCLWNLVPTYLKNYFKVNSHVHNYNTRQRRNIHPNKTNLVLGGRTFKNSGRLAFNSLPSKIKDSSSLEIFKRLLKEHFI